jgi:hypothetical protein
MIKAQMLSEICAHALLASWRQQPILSDDSRQTTLQKLHRLQRRLLKAFYELQQHGSGFALPDCDSVRMCLTAPMAVYLAHPCAAEAQHLSLNAHLAMER